MSDKDFLKQIELYHTWRQMRHRSDPWLFHCKYYKYDRFEDIHYFKDINGAFDAWSDDTIGYIEPLVIGECYILMGDNARLIPVFNTTTRKWLLAK